MLARVSIWEALILGVVQGITEFLPVSSSGHLVLLQKIFGITEPALVFDTAVHGGTLIAVMVVLRRDIWNILRRIIQPLTLYLIIATIPAVIIALLFKNLIEGAFASGAFLGFAFLVTAALLFFSDKLCRRYEKDLSGKPPRAQGEIKWADALIIGLLQAAAIVPGISRSGATISAALSRRLDRNFAARFPFLLSIPAILGALVLQSRDLLKAASAPIDAGVIGPLPLIVGTVSACIVAFFSIRLTIKIVSKYSLSGFALYTGLLGFLVLADKFIAHFFF